jgi:hypothetical protein
MASDKPTDMFLKLTPRADALKAINIINTRGTLDELFRYFHGDPEGTVAASIILHLVEYANGFYSAYIVEKSYRFTEEILNTETAKMSEQQFKIFEFVFTLLLKVLEHNLNRDKIAETLAASIAEYVVNVTVDRKFGVGGGPQKQVRESVRHVLGKFLTNLSLVELRRLDPASSGIPSG